MNANLNPIQNTAGDEDAEGSEPPIHGEESQFVRWFRAAASYIYQFHEKTFVIAFGGEVLEESRARLQRARCTR
jgi:amino-acid N-acetyltransferase